jgi:hypothetical protein
VRILAVTTAVFFVTTVLFGLMAFSPGAAPIKTSTTRQAVEASVEDQVRGIAERFLENLITYNYRTITADLNRLQRDTSPNFPKQFHSAMRGDVAAFRKRIIDQRASSTGDAKGSTLISSDDDTATVLVFGYQTVRSNRTQGDLSRYIINELTLVKTPQGWKVDSARVPSSVSGQARG